MIRVYGSRLCPDCICFEESLKRNNISYEFVDIHENMANLKAFLRLRDMNPAFDDVKKNGFVGIPAIDLEGEIELDWEKYLQDLGITVAHLEQEKSLTCSVDGKGC